MASNPFRAAGHETAAQADALAVIGHDDGAADLAGYLAHVARPERSLAGLPRAVLGDGYGWKGNAFVLHVHPSSWAPGAVFPPLFRDQKKSDSQPMRRPVTLPKVPVAACRADTFPRPARFL